MLVIISVVEVSKDVVVVDDMVDHSVTSSVTTAFSVKESVDLANSVNVKDMTCTSVVEIN